MSDRADFAANLICIAARLRSIRHFHLSDGYAGDNVMARQFCKDADYLEQQARAYLSENQPNDAGSTTRKACRDSTSRPLPASPLQPIAATPDTHTFDVNGPASGYAKQDQTAQPTGVRAMTQQPSDYCREFGCYMNHADPPIQQTAQPVAWMYERDDGEKYVYPLRRTGNTSFKETPLYASQPIPREPTSCQCAHDPTPDEEASRVCRKCGKPIIV